MNSIREKIIRYTVIAVLIALTVKFGVIPRIIGDEGDANRRAELDSINKKLDEEYSVIVVGEQPEGITAAVAAARLGLKTLLICEEANLSSDIKESLKVVFNPGFDNKGFLLSRGIYEDMYNAIGANISNEAYNEYVSKLVQNQKNLEVYYSLDIDSVTLKKGQISAVNAISNAKELTFKADIFIDATKDGKLLELSGVPFFYGSEDLNLIRSYAPLELNFRISGVDFDELNKMTRYEDEIKFVIQDLITGYEPINPNLVLTQLQFIKQEDNSIIVHGLRFAEIDIANEKEIKDAYVQAVAESKAFFAYLKATLNVFEKGRFEEPAESFYIPEYRHFTGMYVLTANDVIENADFDLKIAVDNHFINADKFNLGNMNYDFILGAPEMYSIPIDCILPINLDNVFMVGRNASYSSLASLAANNIATNMTTGEVAGYASYYCLFNKILPKQITELEETKRKEFTEFLQKAGVYLPTCTNTTENFQYPAYKWARVLNNIAVISGGIENDEFRFKVPTTEGEMSTILVNATFKLDKDKYSIAMDERMKQYYDSSTKVTLEKGAEILLAFHGISKEGNPVNDCVSKGYISKEFYDRIKDKDYLLTEDIYELCIKNTEIMVDKKLVED